MQTVAAIIADTARQKAPWRTAFNVAQYAASFGAAPLIEPVNTPARRYERQPQSAAAD